MSYLRLAVCVGGVYAMFLLWAIAQERLSVPFQSIDGSPPAKFGSALVMSICQSVLSSLSALVYISLRKPANSSLSQSLGFHLPSFNTILLLYLQCAFFITTAAPFGFAALTYISYPAMVLAKSCKLVPVMLMNVLLYRRKFAPYKYLVVGIVTTGITLFMFFGNSKRKAQTTSDHPYASAIGMTYLFINLAIDGATNSTQDEIFSRHPITGQQMMFFINVFSTLINLALCVVPLPYIPVIHPTNDPRPEFVSVLEFIRTHPGVISPLFQFALTGALGQLFIFETLQHFGSLTLVTITLTRKLFTMLLSVIVYRHSLTPGQWLGTGTVFAGITLEAYIKRKDVHAKRVIAEKEKAKIKSL